MVGYPTKKQKVFNQNSYKNYAGRGMSLEQDLNISNNYYNETGRALIHKKPTPIQVVSVDYPNRSCAKITEAYYKTPSTTDYNGIYRGRPIDFEAKEIKSKTSLPFEVIHPHQIEHLKKVLKLGGIGFFVIRFTSHDETFIVDAAVIIDKYEHSQKKSISYKEIQTCGILIQQGFIPRLKYLDTLDMLYFKEELHE